MSSPHSEKSLILDANVLIDYAKSDPRILTQVCRHIGQIIVPAPILDEVDDLTEEDCRVLGLQIRVPSLEQIIRAVERRGRLAENDHLCLLMAYEEGHACVTNDARLRRECEQMSVPLLWGLELMVMLHRCGRISASTAGRVAHRIHESNPRYITQKILARFFRNLSLH